MATASSLLRATQKPCELFSEVEYGFLPVGASAVAAVAAMTMIASPAIAAQVKPFGAGILA